MLGATADGCRHFMVYCRMLASILTAGAGMLIAGVEDVCTGVSLPREY